MHFVFVILPIAVLVGGCSVVGHGNSAATSGVRVRYEFSFDARDTVAPVGVHMTLSDMPQGVATLSFSDEWAGRTDIARNFVDIKSVLPSTRVTISPVHPESISVTHVPGDPIELTWRLRATPPSTSAWDAHNHSDVGRELVQLVGYDALIVPDLPGNTPVHATFVYRGLAPAAPMATSFGSRATAGDTIVTADVQLGGLRNALYAFAVRPGEVRSYSSALAGGQVSILMRGRLIVPDSVLVNAVQQVIRAERSFWGTKPPTHYTVSIGVASRGSLAGVRLTNAFVANVDSTRDMTDGGITMLFAHELMHEWLGGILTSAGDTEEGKLKWFTEGLDDYMSKRILRSAGLMTDSAYVAAVNRSLVNHALSTAADSSWTSIVAGYWKDNAMQREPYLRGELLGLRLNSMIRGATDGRTTLDDVLREMSHEATGGGLTEEQVAARIGRVLGRNDVLTELHRYLAGGPIVLPDDALGACATPAIAERHRWDPGLDVEATLKGTVTMVRAGGPADRAGLKDGMKVSRASVYRGDATRQIELGVKSDTGTVLYRYLPIGAMVRVQQFQVKRSGVDGSRCT